MECSLIPRRSDNEDGPVPLEPYGPMGDAESNPARFKLCSRSPVPTDSLNRYLCTS